MLPAEEGGDWSGPREGNPVPGRKGAWEGLWGVVGRREEALRPGRRRDEGASRNREDIRGPRGEGTLGGVPGGTE